MLTFFSYLETIPFAYLTETINTKVNTILNPIVLPIYFHILNHLLNFCKCSAFLPPYL